MSALKAVPVLTGCHGQQRGSIGTSMVMRLYLKTIVPS